MIRAINKHKKEFDLGLVGALLSLGLYGFLRYAAAPLIRRIWVHKVEGLENIPRTGPVIIASNHESYFDFICFWAISSRRVQYLAAEKFYRSKFWRPIMVATGQIRVDRESADKKNVHEQAHAILKNEGVLGIFPEGTRSRTGEMGRAYTGAAKFALSARVPIVPVGLIGTHEAWPPHKKLPKLKKVSIKIDKPIFHHGHYDKEHTEELLRHLTDELMVNIAKLAGKEYKHHYKNEMGQKREGEIIEGKKNMSSRSGRSSFSRMARADCSGTKGDLDLKKS